MLFNKDFSDIDYEDILFLKDNQIEESDILDYKRDYSHANERNVNNVIKEVASFSNSSGGFLIYGIEESGSAGYPLEIVGIDGDFNHESLEQSIISNIRPRISVKIKKIPIPETDKCILIVYVPEGNNQPYYNNKTNKYHKRYNFEAKEMDEHEIDALYQKRFFGLSQFNRYVNEMINFRKSKLPVENRSHIIDGHIIVAPLNFDRESIFSSEGRQLRTDIEQIRFGNYGITGNYLFNGLSRPSKYGVNWIHEDLATYIEVHRNSFVHCSRNYETTSGQYDYHKLWELYLGSDVLRTIELASYLYTRFNYNGKVKIIVHISNCFNSRLDGRETSKCDSEEIHIEREWDSWDLIDDKSLIGKSIMDEVCNHFGFWETRYSSVNEDGEVMFGL